MKHRPQHIALFLLVLFTLACATETPVTGELFVVTKGAGNYKLGAVTVAAYLKDDFDSRVEAFKRNIEEETRTAKARRDSCSGRVSAASNPYGFEREIADCFAAEQATIVTELSKMLSPDFPPKVTATTNADGKFSIKLPAKGDYYLVATATRSAGADEHYFFLHPVKGDGTEKSEIISNRDMIDADSLKSLLK